MAGTFRRCCRQAGSTRRRRQAAAAGIPVLFRARFSLPFLNGCGRDAGPLAQCQRMAGEPLREYAAALYDRLRALARARMLGQRAGHTLDPTGLANEAILRLLNCDPERINDDEHFM